MAGIFYGIGVGPGDPELITMKALKVMKECEIVAIPVSDRTFEKPQLVRGGEESELLEALLQKCVAYQIALPVCAELADKQKLYLPMPMIKEKETLKKVHDLCAEAVGECLQNGQDVAFLTLGDAAVYSTYLYVKKRIDTMGMDTCLIPGIPSFVAAAARLNMGLAENDDEIHIFPASYQIDEGLKLSGTKILMKSGKKIPLVKRQVEEAGLSGMMVENCGMSTEKVYENIAEIPEDAGYYSLIIIK